MLNHLSIYSYIYLSIFLSTCANVGGGGGNEAITIISMSGISKIVISSRLDAASAEGRLLEMRICTESALVPAVTWIG